MLCPVSGPRPNTKIDLHLTQFPKSHLTQDSSKQVGFIWWCKSPKLIENKRKQVDQDWQSTSTIQNNQFNKLKDWSCNVVVGREGTCLWFTSRYHFCRLYNTPLKSHCRPFLHSRQFGMKQCSSIDVSNDINPSPIPFRSQRVQMPGSVGLLAHWKGPAH